MKNKLGILPLLVGKKKTFPTTLEEIHEFPFIALSSGMEAVTSSRSKLEMDKIMQGDLVMTAAGQLMVFLAAAKESIATIRLLDSRWKLHSLASTPWIHRYTFLRMI